MSDIVDIGSSTLDPNTNEIKVQAKAPQIGDDPDDAPGYDGIPLVCGLGVTARPFPRTSEGNAQGVVDTDLPGVNGWIVAARDQRKSAAGVVEELGEGETATHSTGPGFDSRTFHKEQLWAAMVGDDCAIIVDRKEERISISIAGLHFELSRQNGACMADGQGGLIQLKEGIACVNAQSIILGGRMPLGPVAYIGPSGPTPAPGVFIGG